MPFLFACFTTGTMALALIGLRISAATFWLMRSSTWFAWVLASPLALVLISVRSGYCLIPSTHALGHALEERVGERRDAVADRIRLVRRVGRPSEEAEPENRCCQRSPSRKSPGHHSSRPHCCCIACHARAAGQARCSHLPMSTPPGSPKRCCRSDEIRACGNLHSPREGVVPRGGIEPPTLRFSVACSTN